MYKLLLTTLYLPFDTFISTDIINVVILLTCHSHQLLDSWHFALAKALETILFILTIPTYA